MAEFERHKLADCLVAQAHLCERIAGSSVDRAIAEKFKVMAKECRKAAETEQHNSTKAEWPAVLAF
jgi:hypothetical protein